MNGFAQFCKAINDLINNNPIFNIVLSIVLAYSSASIFRMIYKIHKMDKEEEKRIEEMRQNAKIISFPSHDNFKG